MVLTMSEMNSNVSIETERLTAIRRIQMITISWMLVEVVVSAVVAVHAHSIAVLGFGGDSMIELLSALAVLVRFSGKGLSEQRTSRIAAVLLYSLAGFIVAASAFSMLKLWVPPQPSYLGIALLVSAAAVMPWLARRKRQLSIETGSSALAADAVQSSVCAWMAWISMAGLVFNALFGISWADPLAALAITPIIMKEAHDTWHERGCRCC